MAEVPSARPLRYIARSSGLRVVGAQSRGVFGKRRPDFVGAVEAGDFVMAKEILESDASLSALHVALGNRWIKLERLYRFNFQHPLPA